MDFGTTKTSIIQYYHDNYPFEYYRNYPETCVKKMFIEKSQMDKILTKFGTEDKLKILHKQYDVEKEQENLSKLPSVDERTKDNITKWLMESSFTFDDIIGVGW